MPRRWILRSARHQRSVSLKIFTAEQSKRSQEVHILHYLRQRQLGDKNHFIVTLLHDFIHKGPNGEHQCMVFELLGPTLAREVADNNDIFNETLDPDEVKRFVLQILYAIEWLHSIGIAHGGKSTLYQSK